MPDRRETNHARSLGGEQCWHKRRGKEKMTQVIHSELRLPPAFEPRLGTGHDSGVVDQQVDLSLVFEEFGGGTTHASEIAEIHGQRNDLALCNTAKIFLRLLRVANRHVNLGPYRRKCPSRLQPDA